MSTDTNIWKEKNPPLINTCYRFESEADRQCIGNLVISPQLWSWLILWNKKTQVLHVWDWDKTEWKWSRIQDEAKTFGPFWRTATPLDSCAFTYQVNWSFLEMVVKFMAPSRGLQSNLLDRTYCTHCILIMGFIALIYVLMYVLLQVRTTVVNMEVCYILTYI